MVVNPAGFQPVFDFGNPQAISGRAREVISGGQLVYISGATGVTSSGNNSFDPSTDLLFLTGASGTLFAGIAMATVGSNSIVSVATKGAYLITAAGTITPGATVIANGGDAVATGTTAGMVMGRALTAAGSEGYTLVLLG